MRKLKDYVLVCNFLLFLELLGPLCQGDKFLNAAIQSEDWETKLALNSSFELGGRVQRSSYPPGFVLGSAGAAYQYEGAVDEGGKGPSIWDVFVRYSGKVKGNATGDIAADQYHRYKEDIRLMKDLGLDAYRFSISWSRILPVGRGNISWAGVAYYNRFIDELIRQGVIPYVTLFHWDLPQALELTGGWLDSNTVSSFAEYAELCFSLFGDRVKHWITFNEIHTFAVNGYYTGIDAPGRCSTPFGNCFEGNSRTEPLIVAHNVLIAHALAVDIYRTKFKEHHKGSIGLTVDGVWLEPCMNTEEDREASQRANEYWLGWILDPIFYGDYPSSMRHYDPSLLLPKFTKEQSDLLANSADFVGLNQYTAQFATFDPFSLERNDVTISPMCNGVLIGPETAAEWFHVVPYGMRKVLGWLRARYDNPPVYITENGLASSASVEIWSSEQLQDYDRIRYHHDYMQSMLLAIQDGSDVRGYFAWSLLDNFEWHDGYSVRFGFFQVDFDQSLQRRAKASADWFKQVLHKEGKDVSQS